MLEVQVEAADAGFDAGRLGRIDRHFARYVDDGRLAGWLVLVARSERIVHLSTYGRRDIEADLPVELDTRWRIYSMTKPITSVAAMSLWEEGAFELKDPVSRFVPAFGDVHVHDAGPAREPVRMWHPLTHTAGLTYGFHHAHPVDAMYREAGFDLQRPDVDLAAACDTWASLPLLFEPGSEWNYGVSTDVLGRVVEVIAGAPLDEVLRERVLDPLGMGDTAFEVTGDDGVAKLAALYTPGAGAPARIDLLGDEILSSPTFLSGGGGLASTAADYHRFARMLLRRGELDGVRVLGSRTVDFMARNHLPGGVDLEAFGRPLFAETTFDGVGFGLGFSVVVDPVANKVPASVGDYGWGGMASTVFWVDPVQRLTVLFMTQLLPSSTYPIRSELRQLVHSALVD
jgi:CubicO group peptidase (beta-lactamase class C family)